MKGVDKTRFDSLVEWSRRNGGGLHPMVEIYHDERTKFSLRVRETANGGPEPDFTVATCPTSTTLSYLNALVGGSLSASPPEEPEKSAFPVIFMQETPPHVVGRFFLIQQYLLGKRSFWWPYIQTLPQPEHIASWALPAFWPDEDVDCLVGTNVHAAVEIIQANVRREFKRARKILKETDFRGWQDYTRLLYNWAFCIFTSRSFRPSQVVPEELKQKIRQILRPGCQLDDFSILQPLFDIANHAPEARSTWHTLSDPVPCCHLICRDQHGPGEQVFNNYGLKTNSELLLGYGFIIPETEALHNDYVHLRKRNDGCENGEDNKHNGGPDQPFPGHGRPPRDFLISLRPMSHPSSVVGRARQLVAMDPEMQIGPEFAHVEDGLILDLGLTLMDDGERRGWEEAETSSNPPCGGASSAADRQLRLRALLARPTRPELESLVSRLRVALLAKLTQDYERLEDSAPGGEEEQSPEEAIDASNSDLGQQPLYSARSDKWNKEIAARYRVQCRKVLLAAIGAIGAVMEELPLA